jgi:hypothetical protein
MLDAIIAWISAHPYLVSPPVFFSVPLSVDHSLTKPERFADIAGGVFAIHLVAISKADGRVRRTQVGNVKATRRALLMHLVRICTLTCGLRSLCDRVQSVKNLQDFTAALAKAKEAKQLTVCDFYAQWCPPV